MFLGTEYKRKKKKEKSFPKTHKKGKRMKEKYCSYGTFEAKRKENLSVCSVLSRPNVTIICGNKQLYLLRMKTKLMIGGPRNDVTNGRTGDASIYGGNGSLMAVLDTLFSKVTGSKSRSTSTSMSFGKKLTQKATNTKLLKINSALFTTTVRNLPLLHLNKREPKSKTY